MSGIPLDKRPGFTQTLQADDLQRELRAIAIKHKLIGFVFVEFTSEHTVGTRSFGATDEVMHVMDGLAQRILVDIDDGRHDPIEHIQTKGNA